MLISYLRIALRNIQKQRLNSTIILLGLAFGLSLFILAFTYSDFHFTFDTFHRHIDRIHIINRIIPTADEGELHESFTPTPMLNLIWQNFPEIEDATRMMPVDTRVMFNPEQPEKRFYESGVKFVDPNFLSFFDFELISGDPGIVLTQPQSLVITRSAAKKYFGEKDPIGKILKVDMGNSELRITGVLEDVPKSSSIEFDFLVSTASMDWIEDWNQYGTSFVFLSEGVDPMSLDRKFPEFVQNHIQDFNHKDIRLYLHPFRKAHLIASDTDVNGDFYSMPAMILSIILTNAIVLLVIVCLNFMNLSTARYTTRAREVGMRKVFGSERTQLMRQFLGESILLAFIALPLAFALFELIRPVFLALVDPEVELSIWQRPVVGLICIAITLVVGLVSGSYPAFFLSSFKPVDVLRKNVKTGTGGTRARKTLIVVQFALSALLIVSTLVATQQIDFLLNVDLGYDRQNVMVLPFKSTDDPDFESLKHALLRRIDIKAVTVSSDLPFDWNAQRLVRSEGLSNDEALIMDVYSVGFDFAETMGLGIIRGRTFS